jgi:hypothetical protein
VRVGVTALNGCCLAIDGPDAGNECGRILRFALDECDESSTEFKQGWRVVSNCAE